MLASNSNPVILYDGVCGLCGRLLRFTLKHDSHDRFRVAALQSDFAIRLLCRHGIDPEVLDTMYLVLDYELPGECLASRSDAIVGILREFGGGWRLLGTLLRLLPKWFRNWGYNLVARNRYRIFGKFDSCMIPAEKDRNKFLDSI